MLFGELTANLFNNVLLKNGYLSVDIGAGPKHGKWAHTIQLFLREQYCNRVIIMGR
ncbi:LirA/MavJ family T4SS effector [Legionella sainthelensi]|uniref:LirA/MavJ family T4SS effector n=1 Tax=Legionella sainthelensi TaxID=28087 RepID=UPI0022AA8A5F|nr:LirA/MavJ family T4SS effector [Legionella sainthelensi]